ncbi:hypothetical protein SAMN05216337_108814 [Bradyrhizobium brasilense]|uniref:NfeD-like C-terminal domain-containing protein n=1 Tax=Bradyrhizobium brasilense TaxID=1419277 RepID=A0A1G7Q0K6_9BRAD|nr:hypothetical protein [Bradyrhizobium brasilense]SDF92011.1 hypothetical protein SAMN05216337_108814 [Bradyrhizobium brasilense]
MAMKLGAVWLEILLPAAAMSATASQTPDERESIVALTVGAAIVRSPATKMLRGVVDRVDQARNNIDMRLSHDWHEMFRVQGGLIFDAVRFGDPVEISVQTIPGARTIVCLLKE